MGILVGLPRSGGKDLQIEFGKMVTEQTAFFPAEWYPQSGIQLTWPHGGTDWAYMLEEVEQCFIRIACEIAQRERLVIVTPHPAEVQQKIKGAVNMGNVRFAPCETNDTWARDHGAITIMENGGPALLDFRFNGWGLKFASDKDNLITRQLHGQGMLSGKYVNKLEFVLEGGAIDCDGMGSILTTSRCLLSPNRNGHLNRVEIETYLRSALHAEQVLWLDYGYLRGDDTDSHIDTLARFCSSKTIAYVKCDNPLDEHYEELEAMEKQLRTFRTLSHEPYQLIPLPLPDPVMVDNERLPATYANFLIINGAVLYPTYNQPQKDAQVKEILKQAFPQDEIIGIDCRALVKQHGSLHCVTMQYPRGVIK